MSPARRPAVRAVGNRADVGFPPDYQAQPTALTTEHDGGGRGQQAEERREDQTDLRHRHSARYAVGTRDVGTRVPELDQLEHEDIRLGAQGAVDENGREPRPTTVRAPPSARS